MRLCYGIYCLVCAGLEAVHMVIPLYGFTVIWVYDAVLRCVFMLVCYIQYSVSMLPRGLVVHAWFRMVVVLVVPRGFTYCTGYSELSTGVVLDIYNG